MKAALLEPLGMRDTHFVVPVSFHISLLRIKFLDLFFNRDVCETTSAQIVRSQGEFGSCCLECSAKSGSKVILFGRLNTELRLIRDPDKQRSMIANELLGTMFARQDPKL